jgi:hypothetical protein
MSEDSEAHRQEQKQIPSLYLNRRANYLHTNVSALRNATGPLSQHITAATSPLRSIEFSEFSLHKTSYDRMGHFSKISRGGAMGVRARRKRTMVLTGSAKIKPYEAY